jgi:spore coat protein U-like protein
MILRTALLAAALAALPAAARAQTCTVLGVTGVAFGAYDPIGANATVPRDSTGQLHYRCRGGAAPLVTLSTGASGSYQPRQLRQAARSLGYNLYRDAARAQIWGNGTGGTFTVQGQRGNRTLVIYGRIFPGQVAAAGSYADTIVATLNF